MRRLFWGLITMAGCCALLAGCGRTPEVRFYSLRPLATAADPVPAPRVAASGEVRTVTLSSVKLAGYLRRPQLVRRTAPYQIAYLDYDRWAGSPEEEIGEVLAESLAGDLGPGWRVARENGPAAPPAAVRLEVEVLQMELDATGLACLKARWTCAGGVHEAAFTHGGSPAEAHRANLIELVHRMAWDVKLAR